MMVFRGRVSFPKFDAKKYTANLQKEMEVQMRQAARAWLRAVLLKVPPAWTGTSRGSLRPLGRVIQVAIPIYPVVTRKGFGPEVGEALGGFKFERDQRRFIFKFDTAVRYFITNNFHNVSPPLRLINKGPYGAFEAGQKAWEEYVNTLMRKRIPRIKDYIKFKSEVFGG